jgi:hypothetical protein
VNGPSRCLVRIHPTAARLIGQAQYESGKRYLPSIEKSRVRSYREEVMLHEHEVTTRLEIEHTRCWSWMWSTVRTTRVFSLACSCTAFITLENRRLRVLAMMRSSEPSHPVSRLPCFSRPLNWLTVVLPNQSSIPHFIGYDQRAIERRQLTHCWQRRVCIERHPEVEIPLKWIAACSDSYSCCSSPVCASA